MLEDMADSWHWSSIQLCAEFDPCRNIGIEAFSSIFDTTE